MTTWKFIILMVALLVPGGSLLLLAMATAKALNAGRDRLLLRAPVMDPMAVAALTGGKG
jgi:hypothetical protein